MPETRGLISTSCRGTTEPVATAATPGTVSVAVFVGTRADLGPLGPVLSALADAPDLVDHLVAPVAEVLAKVVADSSPAAVLLASSADGKEAAARLALKDADLDIGVVTDVGQGGSWSMRGDGVASQAIGHYQLLTHLMQRRMKLQQ